MSEEWARNEEALFERRYLSDKVKSFLDFGRNNLKQVQTNRIVLLSSFRFIYH